MSLVNNIVGSTKPKSGLARAMDKIYFEKQEGRLCGLHCLNNALQSSMFSVVDLSSIARGLDEQERLRMAELGTHTQEYKEFISRPSANYDDSGYFSVQVLALGLKNVNLDMVPWMSNDTLCEIARDWPTEQRLYILNMNDHWFSIRRFGSQWINLNSVLKAPELVSDTYLVILLTTLQKEGYTVFVVFGELPYCPTDKLFNSLKRDIDGKYIDDEGQKLGSCLDEEGELQRGIDLSLAKTPAEAIRAQRAAFLSKLASPSASSSGS